jgi:recombination protein RecA
MSFPLPVKKKRSIDPESLLGQRVAGAAKALVELGQATEEEAEESLVDVPERQTLNASKMEHDIQRLLKLSAFEPDQRYWLDTGSEDMNATLGSRKYGLPYGKMYEFRGKNHGGKTTLCTLLAGMAQRDGAGIGYVDVEDSRDETWAEKLGLKYDEVVKVYPKLITDSKNKPPRLESAEELFAEAEAGMELMRKQGFVKQFWFLDSVANLRPAMVIEKGVTGQNARTKLELSSFLSQNLARWTGLAANYNAMIILINQIRVNPMQMFGDPEYSPGGNAFQHTCAIRATIRRIKDGKLRKGTTIIGLLGLVTNFKNKAGKGSVQDQSCAFAIRWRKTPALIKFMTKDAAEELMK